MDEPRSAVTQSMAQNVKKLCTTCICGEGRLLPFQFTARSVHYQELCVMQFVAEICNVTKCRRKRYDTLGQRPG